jgi:uncharacterized SAM-binding protein YcdF (DUF218 family)
MKKGQLKKEFTDKVNNHLLIERTELCKADLGFIFGSKHFSDKLAESAASHYHKGYFSKVIVTGGVVNKQGEIEAHYIKKSLINKNVPAQDILIEDQSTNTQENIENAKRILDEHIGLENIKSIIGFGQLYAARRYIMTLKRRWPEVFAMHVSVNGFNCPKEQWHLHERFKYHVLSEWEKLSHYEDLDYIKEVDIDAINNKAKNTARLQNK